MVTLVCGLLSGIFALIAILAHVFEKNGTSSTTASQNAVTSQLSAIDAKITANNNQAAQVAAQTAAQEQGETNASILQDINDQLNKSNPNK